MISVNYLCTHLVLCVYYFTFFIVWFLCVAAQKARTVPLVSWLYMQVLPISTHKCVVWCFFCKCC